MEKLGRARKREMKFEVLELEVEVEEANKTFWGNIKEICCGKTFGEASNCRVIGCMYHCI